jgi:hypothetical protein
LFLDGLSDPSKWPYDADIAVSDKHVVLVVNGKWAVIDKAIVAGREKVYKITERELGVLFHTEGKPVDPKCLWDDLRRRWIIVAVDLDRLPVLYIAISKTDDPSFPGNWIIRHFPIDSTKERWADGRFLSRRPRPDT